MDTTVTPATAGNEPPAKENPEAAKATPPEKSTEFALAKTEQLNQTEPPVQEHDWKKRFEGTSQAHKQLSEEHQQVIDSNVKLVEKNPELLNDLADTNPKLADQVSRKLYDKSYDSYRKDKELESLKKSDPDRYAQEKRIKTLEERDATRTESDRKDFLKSKGIKDNEFDPAYKKVKAQLNMFNPEYVEESPSEAWSKAYQLAFPSSASTEKTKEDAALAWNSSKRGGLSSILSHKQSTKSPEAQAFADKLSMLTSK